MNATTARTRRKVFNEKIEQHRDVISRKIFWLKKTAKNSGGSVLALAR